MENPQGENLNYAQVCACQSVHFPHIASGAPDNVNLNTCAGAIISLREEHSSHIKCQATGFKLFTFPLDFPVDTAQRHADGVHGVSV